MNISQAVKILKNGGVVAYPTETFYGLGADPTNPEAIEKIFKIKERDRGKPIMLILASPGNLKQWVKGIHPKAKKLMSHFWPGPLTLIFQAKKGVPSFLTAGTNKLAVRVSSEKLARELAYRIGGALTATSANISGQPPARTATQARRLLKKKISGVVSNKRLKETKGSTIIDVSNINIKVVREGKILLREIEHCLMNQRPRSETKPLQ